MPGTSRPLILAPDEAGIAHAAEVLRKGGLVAVPTETVYGLAARADSDEAVASIYRAKGRPDFNPLIVHVASVENASRLALFDERAQKLAEAFWPGPLTMVLPRRGDAGLASAVSAGLSTIALRCPSHPVMRARLAGAGLPLAAPSANRSGAVSPTHAQHVAASLGETVDCILDGGSCEAGIESTIVALRPDGGWQVLRPGPITMEQVAGVLGSAPDVGGASGAIEAPGQLSSHYSPGKPIRLCIEHADADEYHIGFGPITGAENLSPAADLAIAAAKLYAALHRAADSDKPRIAIAPIPGVGIGAAINDRLGRAKGAATKW
jgi:L-threonylcarbamoyladenylate synthase